MPDHDKIDVMRRGAGALLAIALVTSGCIEEGDSTAGVGVVAEGLDDADRVQVAWIHLDAILFVEVVALHGAVSLEDGVFSLDELIEAQADFTPPTVLCPLEAAQTFDGVAGDPSPAPYAWGAIVATRADADPPPVAPLDELEDYAVATSTEVAMLWASEPVARDSLWGRRIETSLSAGLQLVSVRDCRLGLECQTQCFDPLGAGSFVLLGRL